ncbi:unnamed protein product [Oikopleura dioica]|uniref:MARVEL domain-containing protein n=1 Tax=Oikopleura dioica TaxID=34765 RepID=E4XZ42_OIKDI|nr:unnamed protein product [Oikopleura dioica]
MGIELHTKFRLLHAALCFLSIVILLVLGVTNLSRDQPPPWIFLAPLIILCLAFILSTVFCIVRVVIRVNFPVVGFAAHGLASVLYAAAATILLYAFIFLPKSPLFTTKEKLHPAGTCANFNLESASCTENWDSCQKHITYCHDRMEALTRGGINPDITPKSMVIVDISLAYICMLTAFIGAYFAYEDYQDSEYEEESMDGEGAAGGSGGTRQCYTLGRANLEHSPKPSQMV